MYNLHLELAIGDKLYVLKADTDEVKNHFLEAVAVHNQYSGTDFPSMNFYANYWKFVCIPRFWRIATDCIILYAYEGTKQSTTSFTYTET